VVPVPVFVACSGSALISSRRRSTRDGPPSRNRPRQARAVEGPEVFGHEARSLRTQQCARPASLAPAAFPLPKQLYLRWLFARPAK
jgi:hypothetical protein